MSIILLQSMEDSPKTLADLLTPLDVGLTRLADIEDPKEFAIAVLSSHEFRTFIVHNLTLGSLAPAIVTRLMDYGWGAPPKKLEITKREQVTEVKRVVIALKVDMQEQQLAEAAAKQQPVSVH